MFDTAICLNTFSHIAISSNRKMSNIGSNTNCHTMFRLQQASDGILTSWYKVNTIT